MSSIRFHEFADLENETHEPNQSTTGPQRVGSGSTQTTQKLKNPGWTGLD